MRFCCMKMRKGSRQLPAARYGGRVFFLLQRLEKFRAMEVRAFDADGEKGYIMGRGQIIPTLVDISKDYVIIE